MMKNFLKCQRGINLITLSVAVIVILILTNIIIYNVKDNMEVQNLKNMQADIQNLRDKISNYYTQYGEIPANKNMPYTNTSGINVISQTTDTGKFYVIDLSSIDNLTLNFGKEYKKVTNGMSQNNIDKLEDIYIINEDSHNIFYVKGILFEGERFYTDYTVEGVDKEAVKLHTDETKEIWSPIYQTQAIYKDANEDTAIIPNGFQVSRKEGENTIYNGLVIKNEKTEDKYVWIQVPKVVFKTATSETDYEKIEQDLKTYTESYNNENYEDEYFDGCGIETKDEYDNLKNQMLSSIYKNNGFWISQYEAGVEEERTSVSVSLPIPVSKEGAYPYNYIKQQSAQQAATKVMQNNLSDNQIKKTEDETRSSLMFGIQWNLVLKFIETNGQKDYSDIRKNSTSWGNYSNASFDISKGKNFQDSWYNINNTDTKAQNNNVLLTTGATDRNSVLNIYDLAGNLSEITLEKSVNNKGVCRGGSYKDEGSKSVDERQEIDQEVTNNIGFRIAIY